MAEPTYATHTFDPTSVTTRTAPSSPSAHTEADNSLKHHGRKGKGHQ